MSFLHLMYCTYNSLDLFYIHMCYMKQFYVNFSCVERVLQWLVLCKAEITMPQSSLFASGLIHGANILWRSGNRSITFAFMLVTLRRLKWRPGKKQPIKNGRPVLMERVSYTRKAPRNSVFTVARRQHEWSTFNIGKLLPPRIEASLPQKARYSLQWVEFDRNNVQPWATINDGSRSVGPERKYFISFEIDVSLWIHNSRDFF